MNYVQQLSIDCTGIRNLYIHARMNETKYFNVSHDREKGCIQKTDRFQQDPGFSEILDSRLTKEDMEKCNLVISLFWFIRTTSLFLHLLVNIRGLFCNIMGNYIARPVASSNNIHISRHYGDPSNLKLKSQNVIEFLGGIEDCQKQKSRAECSFGGSGYDQLIYDDKLTENNQQMNRIVYSQLSVANVGGTAHRLVKTFKDMKNGNSYWRLMCEWYDGDVIKLKLQSLSGQNQRATASHRHQTRQIP